MKTQTSTILKILSVLIWIIFLGLCYKAGIILVSAIVSLFVDPETVQKLYLELDLRYLLQYDKGYYIIIISLIVVATALKAYVFYQLIKISQKINLVSPFSVEVYKLITRIAYIMLVIGLLTNYAKGYSEWLMKKGVSFPPMTDYIGAGSEFLFFGGVVFFIAQIFKRGIEIQSENELTV